MKNKELNLNEKIRELDLKVMNDEISLLTFLNLRSDLDKEFIKRLKEGLWALNLNIDPFILEDLVNSLAGPKLTK